MTSSDDFQQSVLSTPPRRLQDSNSGQQAQQQVALPTELSCQPFQLSSALPILSLHCSKLLRELGVNMPSPSRHTGTHYGLL